MAGGKESPRQKMIGMMYLVLTALLALNVSKEIINAFVTQDTQMLTTNNNLVQGINGFLTKFSLVELDPNTKKTFVKWKPKIEKTIRLSNQIDDYILENQNLMMKEAEGVTDWFTKNTESQLTTWEDFEEITKKEDYDIPTRLFGGESSTKGFKTGAEIRGKLLLLRDSLILEMGTYSERGKAYTVQNTSLKTEEEFSKYLEEQKHPDKEKLLSIYQTLSQPEKLKNHGEDQAWQLVKFDHQPIVGAIGVFTELRNQIRMAEQKALELVYGKLDQQLMPINKIEPQIIADTRYINIGDTIGVKVGIVAYDSTATYPIRYTIGEEKIVSTDNNFTVKGTSAGKQTVEGMLSLNLADGKKDFPWKFDYTVGKPMGTIALPEYDVLYSNWDNKIEAAISGFDPAIIDVKCDGCDSFVKRGTIRVAKVKPRKTVTITVKAPGVSFSKKYKTLPLPTPEIFFMGVTGGGKISANIIRNGTIVKVKPPESSPLKVEYEVLGFEFDVVTSRPTGATNSNTRKLTTEMKNKLRNIRRGNRVYINKVKYRIKGSTKVKYLKTSMKIVVT